MRKLGLVMTVAVTGLVALAWVRSPAAAASFDCAKASAEIEKRICESPKVSALDSELARAYKEARAEAGKNGMPGKEALLAAQKAWLSDRDSCTSVGCLERAYNARITVLRLPPEPFPGWFGRFVNAGGISLSISHGAGGAYRLNFSGAGADYTCDFTGLFKSASDSVLEVTGGDVSGVTVETAGTGVRLPDTDANEQLQASACGMRAPSLLGDYARVD